LDYLLTDRQQEILSRWAAAGAPKGMDQRSNTPGRIELVTPALDTADQSLDLSVRTWDAELDGLVVGLWAREPGGESFSMGEPLGGGLRSASIDTGTLTSKASYEIYAVVDDGYDDNPDINKQNEVVLLPAVYIDHGLRGTAPRVELLSPNGGNTLVGGTTITWAASDPDVGDSLTLDLDLIPQNGSAPIPIAHGLKDVQSYVWTIPASVPTHDATNTPIEYTVRVTATDMLGMPQNVRSDDSDATFTIEPMLTTTYTWTKDTKTIFAMFCTKNCHDASGTGSNLAMCLLQYKKGENPSGCDATDTGAFENRLDILAKIPSSMPPKSAPQPTQAQRNIIANWIQGGAPYGDGGSNDATPTFTWTSPGAGKLVASGGTATLAWNVADDKGLTSDVVAYRKIKGTNSASQCNNDCTAVSTQFDTSTPVFITITTGSPTGTAQARTFDWTTPSQGVGCYCVEGTVTDNAGQSTTGVRAQNAVKF
jgi:hypothetical protein